MHKKCDETMTQQSWKEEEIPFLELIRKVPNKLQACKGELLSFGEKSVLINNMFASVPIYIILDINPPNLLFMI